MRVLILTLGTRGDVSVFLTLARELKRRGHAVTFAASPFYQTDALDAGIAWLPVGTGSRAELVAILRAISDIDDPRQRVKAYAQAWVRPQLAAGMPQLKQAASGADYFINNLRSVWQRGGRAIPGAEVTYDPPADIDRLSLYASHQPTHADAILQLVAMNRELVDPDNAWGARYHFTGFWRDPSRRHPEPPGDLQAFVERGPPPLVLTMGSMVMFDPRRLADVFRHALAQAGQRGVLITSWAGRAADFAGDQRLLALDEAPYDWLFQRAACVVHHGGCGTVAAVLQAGVPSILMPQISSQQHFAELLDRQQLVAGVVDAQTVTAAELAITMGRAMHDPDLHAACALWRRKLAQDPGVSRAAEAIEAHASRLGLRGAPGDSGCPPDP